jgi:phosphonate transport system ATP-binding protein
MIFQQFNLMKRHTCSQRVAGPRPQLCCRACAAFPGERSGPRLSERSARRPGASRADALSGGQQQRVAIARALMQEPRLILADEPVASLDPALRHSVMRHIEALNREEGLTVLCSLHDIDLWPATPRGLWRCATGAWSGRDRRGASDRTPSRRSTARRPSRPGSGLG